MTLALAMNAESAPSARAINAVVPLELSEAALEALLFVAERPLSRREIATLAHELGHAFHSWVMRDLPDSQRS